MAKRKTESDYAADIAELHAQLMEYPDSESIQKKIDYRVKKWMTFLDIHIEVANNEQTPWTASMLGYPTIPMQTKKSTGYDQIADYVGVVQTCNGDRYIDLIVERKSIEDLYGTLIIEDSRERFYNEIARFKADDRFTSMMVIVEGTMSDFILYQPVFSDGGKFDYARRYDNKKNDSINEKKLTILADLFIADTPVIFADNRVFAAQFCGRLLRESVRKGYAKILALQDFK